jgi:hypothetical protein
LHKLVKVNLAVAVFVDLYVFTRFVKMLSQKVI